MKKSPPKRIVTNIIGSDIPGLRLVLERRASEKIPKIAILEIKKSDGKNELHIVIKGLNRKDKQDAKQALTDLAYHFEFVPTDELYARMYPQVKLRKSRSRKTS